MNLFALALLTALPAHADGWSPRILCGTTMVVDGLENMDGLRTHQIVVRDGAAIQYLASLVPGGLKTNMNSEWIVSPATFGSDAAVDAPVKDVPNGNTIDRFSVSGRFLDWSRYELRITRLNMYPGMTSHEPQTLGNWVFNDCRRLR